MANIFLTRKCNLKCPYCFADEFVNKENQEFTLENFKTVLNFIKQDKNERIGLIGGEPTLYPYFQQILNLLNNDSKINSYIIYTNGIEIDKYIESLVNNKAYLLINCNSPIDISTKYNKLKENISLLASKNIKNFDIGINLYSMNFNYSYIFDLLKIANKNNLRFSTSLPNTEKEITVNSLKMFREFKPFLFKFFDDCIKNNIFPYNDCNAIPTCLLDKNDKLKLIKLKRLADKYNINCNPISSETCTPIIDILPDLNAVRCFGLSKYLKVPITNFKNIGQLRRYFYNKIDIYTLLSFASSNCEDCKSRIYEKCGLCLTYKINQSNKIKNFVIENAIEE